MKIRYCPKCRAKNDFTAPECVECGVLFQHIRRPAEPEEVPAGIPERCSVEGCCYPPGFTRSTRGGGTFVCRFHATETDPVMSRQIAEQSDGFIPETEQSRIAEIQAAANAFCRASGLNTVEQRREFIRARFKSLGKGTAPAKAPAARVAETA